MVISVITFYRIVLISPMDCTPCYVPTYIFHIMKQEVKSLMAARFAIRGVL